MTPEEKLEAIKARINGEWDNKQLKQVEELTPDIKEDILYIIQKL